MKYSRYNSFAEFLENYLFLENPDIILQEKGLDVGIYRQLSYDSHVDSCMTSRYTGLVSNEWDIGTSSSNRTDIKAADFVKDYFYNSHDLAIDDLIRYIHQTIYFGYGVTENLTKRDGIYRIYDKIIGLPPEWFSFDNDNKLLFLSKNIFTGEPVDMAKVNLLQYNATYQNPYGEGKFARIYYPVGVKKILFKYGANFAEKFGSVFMYVVSNNIDERRKYDTLNMLTNMIQSGVGVVEGGDDLRTINIEKGGSSSLYTNFIGLCNAEISKAILGQTLTTEQGDIGSQALGKVHYQVRNEIIESDKKFITRYMNQYIRQLVDLNFSVNTYPEFRFFDKEDIAADRANRDKILADMGISFNKEYYAYTYNLDPKHFTLKGDNEDKKPETDDVKKQENLEENDLPAKFRERMSVGTIRRRKDGFNYKKIAEGEWVRVSENNDETNTDSDEDKWKKKRNEALNRKYRQMDADREADEMVRDYPNDKRFNDYSEDLKKWILKEYNQADKDEQFLMSTQIEKWADSGDDNRVALERARTFKKLVDGTENIADDLELLQLAFIMREVDENSRNNNHIIDRTNQKCPAVVDRLYKKISTDPAFHARWLDYDANKKTAMINVINYKSDYLRNDSEEFEKMKTFQREIRIRQTDGSINSDTDQRLKTYGCYFRSLQSIVEEWTGKMLTPEQIVIIKNRLVREGLLGDDTLFAAAGAPVRVIKDTFELLGITDLEVTEVARDTQTPPTEEYNYVLKRYERWRTNLKDKNGNAKKDELNITHFTHMYKDKSVSNMNEKLFDPDSDSTYKYYVKDKNYYTVKDNNNTYKYDYTYRYYLVKKREEN